MPTIDIIVTKRSDDYHAALAENAAVWDAGKSEAEAIGKLIISARSYFGISLQRPQYGRSAKKRRV